MGRAIMGFEEIERWDIGAGIEVIRGRHPQTGEEDVTLTFGDSSEDPIYSFDVETFLDLADTIALCAAKLQRPARMEPDAAPADE